MQVQSVTDVAHALMRAVSRLISIPVHVEEAWAALGALGVE